MESRPNLAVWIPPSARPPRKTPSSAIAVTQFSLQTWSHDLDSVLDVTLAFLHAGDQDGIRLLFAFWVVEGDALSKRSASKGRLDVVEQNELKRKLKERDMPAIIDWWIQEGIEKGIEKGVRATKLENARKMLVEGCEWSFITRITGIKPEDLG